METERGLETLTKTAEREEGGSQNKSYDMGKKYCDSPCWLFRFLLSETPFILHLAHSQFLMPQSLRLV